MNEEENGHLIDDAGALAHDPRCLLCCEPNILEQLERAGGRLLVDKDGEA